MSEGDSRPVAIKLVGRQEIEFNIVEVGGGLSNELRYRVGETVGKSPISNRFTDARVADYVVGLAILDLADLNLGSAAIVDGGHELDVAIRELLKSATGIEVLSIPGNMEHGSVEALIGCDVSVLVKSLPYLRPGGVLLTTCNDEGDARLDLYNSLHRQGLRFRSLEAQRDLISNLDVLVSRVERLFSRNELFSLINN